MLAEVVLVRAKRLFVLEKCNRLLRLLKRLALDIMNEK
jgi:hypothetical protein